MRTNGIYPPSVKPGIPKLGECPRGWKICRFRDVLEVVERKAILEDDAEYQLVIAKRNRGGIEPRVRLRGAEIRTKTQQLITAGDFLISRRQIIHGACGLVPPSLDGALVSNEYTTLLPKDGVLLAEYLAFFSHSLHFQQTCFHSSVGVDVEKMVFRLPKWLHHKLLMPPLSEQEQIAKVLGAWDRAIGLTDRLIEAKQRLKKGLMQQLLTGRLRFPQFGKPTRKHGELPKGWVRKNLKRLGSLTAGGTPSTSVPDYWGGDIPWMSSGELNHRRVFSVEGRITRKGLDNSSAKMIPEHSVLIGLAGQGKTRGTVAINEISLCTNQSVAAIIPNEQMLDSFYLYHHLDSRYDEIRRLSAGDGGRGGLNLSLLRSLVIILPSLIEQGHIARTIDACDHEIQLLIRKRDRLQEQKRGLMQKLLTGELRLKVGKGGRK